MNQKLTPTHIPAAYSSVTRSIGNEFESLECYGPDAYKYTTFEDAETADALALLTANAGILLGRGFDRDDNQGNHVISQTKDGTLKAAGQFIRTKGADMPFQWMKALEAFCRGCVEVNERDGTYRIRLEGKTVKEGIARSGLTGRFERLIDISYTGSASSLRRWMLETPFGYAGSYDPVTEYLQGLVKGFEPAAEDFAWWDKLAQSYFGVSDTLSQAQFSAWLIGAVMRAARPGSKMDNTLVIKGKQGARKSTFFARLGGQFFKRLSGHESPDNTTRIIQAAWIVEAGEIDGIMRKKDVAALKTFLDSTEDELVRKYQEEVSTVPRRCVFAGTTNESSFLNDPTGNRRFWVIQVPDAHVIDTDKLEEERDRLWQMAAWLYIHGAATDLTSEQRAQAELNNEHYAVANPVSDVIVRIIEEMEEALPEGEPKTLALSFDGLFQALNERACYRVTAYALKAYMDALGLVKTRVRIEGQRRYVYIRQGAIAPYVEISGRDISRLLSQL